MAELLKITGCDNQSRKCDVVYIHGLMGHPKDTWTYKDDLGKYSSAEFWPEWLGQDCPEVGVWSLGYESSPSKWAGDNMAMIDRATNLLDHLDADDLGQRPLVFITHSLGGILAKQILRLSHSMSEKSTKHQLHRNTKGIVFFSTPHTGSSLANLMRCFTLFRSTEIPNELAKNDSYLRDLGIWFTDNARRLEIDVLTYAETKKTKGYLVVDASSANPGVESVRPIPFDADHFEICKLSGTGDLRYKQVKKFVLQCGQPRVSAWENKAGNLDGVTVDIKVAESPPTDGKHGERYPDDRVLRYQFEKSGDGREAELTIVPAMDYLSRLQNDEIIDAVPFFWNPFHCQFPNLDITIVNNTSETVVLTDASFIVSNSTEDLSPVIVFKDNNYLMKLAIQNEGWSKICNPVLKCNLSPTSATEYCPDPSIDHIKAAPPFEHEFRLDDFAETYELDLADTFAALGVDVDGILEAGFRPQSMYVMDAMQRGQDTKLAQHLGRFPNLDNNEKWRPFPDGYAVVAGVFEYDAIDADGKLKSYTTTFRARVFLFNVRFDAPMPPSYQYHVELKSNGKDYAVSCPISHSLCPGEPDRFQVRLACPQSARHTFRIVWRFNGDREIVSPKIKLNQFIPRTYANENSEEISPDDTAPEIKISDPRSNDLGCVEKSLLQAMQLSQLRDAAKKVDEDEA